MMETILNLGLNDKSVEGLAKATKNDRFAWDAYRRFVQMYSSVVIGLPKEDLEARLRKMKDSLRRERRHASHRRGLARAGRRVQGLFQGKDRQGFPGGSHRTALGRDRRGVRILDGAKRPSPTAAWRKSPACSARPSTSCKWFSATRARIPARASASRAIPRTGEKTFFGDFLLNAQGEDVVAGIRTPLHLSELKKLMPKVYKQLEKVREKLEKHYRDMQDMEFTVEERQALHAADAHRQALARGHLPHRRRHGQREADQS